MINQGETLWDNCGNSSAEARRNPPCGRSFHGLGESGVNLVWWSGSRFLSCPLQWPKLPLRAEIPIWPGLSLSLSLSLSLCLSFSLSLSLSLWLKQHSSIQASSVAIECVSTRISTVWDVETLCSASGVTEKRWSRWCACVCACVCVCVRVCVCPGFYSPAHIHNPSKVWTVFFIGNAACFIHETTSQWSCHTWEPIEPPHNRLHWN